MLAAKMKDFGKIMMRFFTKDFRMDLPSSRLKSVGGQAGEFIRWSGRFAPAPMEKLCPVGCCPGAKRLSNPHWNGSLK